MILRRNIVRALALSLAAVLALLSGCARQEAPSPLPDIDTYGMSNIYSQPRATASPFVELSIAIVTEPGASTNPIFAVERDIVSLNKLSFESLVELDDALRPVPLLADRWERDGSTWIFYLRGGANPIHFHNGPLLTAHDVVASYNAILQAGVDGIRTPYFNRLTALVNNMTAIDDLTLAVNAKASYFTLYAMNFPVIQRDTIFTGDPMGTGPFWCVARSAQPLKLERNPHWWQRHPKQDYIQSLTAIRYNTAEAALLAFDQKAVDLIATRSIAAALSRSLSDRMTLDFSTLTYEMIVPNIAKNSILADPVVRQAIMYAIDRDELASTVYLDMVQKTEVPVLPGSWLYEPQSTKYNYYPELALKMLLDAGWSDTNDDYVLDRVRDGMFQDLSLRLVTYTEPIYASRYEAVKLIEKQLARVGIKVNVATVSKTQMRTLLQNGDFDLALIANDMSELPDLHFLLSSQGGGSFSGYQSEMMELHLQAARGAQNEEDLITAMSRVQLQLVEDLPIMGLFFRSGVLASRKDLSGLTAIRESDMLRGVEFIGAD